MDTSQKPQHTRSWPILCRTARVEWTWCSQRSMLRCIVKKIERIMRNKIYFSFLGLSNHIRLQFLSAVDSYSGSSIVSKPLEGLKPGSQFYKVKCSQDVLKCVPTNFKRGHQISSPACFYHVKQWRLCKIIVNSKI